MKSEDLKIQTFKFITSDLTCAQRPEGEVRINFYLRKTFVTSEHVKRFYVVLLHPASLLKSEQIFFSSKAKYEFR